MYHFENDYNALCHPIVLNAIRDSADLRMTGYGDDDICAEARNRICELCGNHNLSIHFLSGGTQTNLTVIAAALRPHQAVVAAASGHIVDHESGAIEATGHKIITVPSENGKICPDILRRLFAGHYAPDGLTPEHFAQPKLVYISFSTESGTIYYRRELEELRTVCDSFGAYLYIDGARLGYGLCAADCDVTLADLTAYSDAMYIGGTKQGLMFGEAVVISNPAIVRDFRYIIKQRGGMLAKGWLVGLQFNAMLMNNVYFSAAKQANAFADQIREFLLKKQVRFVADNRTNQIFTTLSDTTLNALAEEFLFCDWMRVDDQYRMVRFCTSWSTTQNDVDALCSALDRSIDA